MAPPPSLPDSTRRDAPARMVAVVTLAVLAVLLAMVLGNLSAAPHTIDLAGDWSAHTERATTPQPVKVPFHASSIGVGVEEPVILERTVDLGPMAPDQGLLIEGAQYHMRVAWDGVILASMGALAGPHTISMRDRLVIPIPAELRAPGPHRLSITVQGEHGRAGLWGEVRLGPISDLERRAASRTAERLALCAMLITASILGLVISAVRPAQREFLWFGMFCAAAAASVFSGDDSWWLANDRLDLKLRVHTAAYALIPGSGLLFVQALVARRAGPIIGMVLGLGGLLGVLALGLPDTAALPHLDLAIDGTAAVTLVVALLQLRRALKDGVDAASSLFLAVSFLVVAAVTERAAVELGAFGLRLLLPAFLRKRSE